MTMSGSKTIDRQNRAMHAALSVAARYGITAVDPSIIKNSNNTIVDLGTSNLVAKVATSTLPDRSRLQLFDAEFAVLSHLHDTNAPTSRLSDQIDHGPHEALGHRLFFLERLEIVEAPFSSADALAVVRAAHDALADLAMPVPDFDANLTVAAALIADPTATATLPTADRGFCSEVARRLREQLDPLEWQSIVLHGDPWINGNLVNTPVGPRLLDFEAVCRGPLEWDLSAFWDGEIGTFAPDLIAICRLIRSFTVAAWCWAQPGRAPEVDEAARWHLHRLRSVFDA